MIIHFSRNGRIQGGLCSFQGGDPFIEFQATVHVGRAGYDQKIGPVVALLRHLQEGMEDALCTHAGGPHPQAGTRSQRALKHD